MTEIPEHLLKRSRERRSALGLPVEGEAGAAETPATTPATTGETAPAPAATTVPAVPSKPAAPAPPPPPEPDPPYVEAAKRRPKIPVWAIGALALLPLWALLYVWALTPDEEEVKGPLAVGAEAYAKCASCHGGQGQGGVGRPFANGEVVKTFPELATMASFVWTGSQPYAGQVYGDPDREGGPHIGLAYNGAAMPGFSAELTPAELVGVICHERYVLAGASQEGEEWDMWCSPDAEMFAQLEQGATLDDVGISTEPLLGGSA